MDDWKAVLRKIADSEDDLEVHGGEVVLSRHGEDRAFELVDVPGQGPSVPQGDDSYVPIAAYIQREFLRLNQLAVQISRTIERSASDKRKRPVPFIDGPASTTDGSGKGAHHERSAKALHRAICTPPAGTTSVIQLMAGAGYGKTVLLEEIARDLARSFQPHDHPQPLLLPVDLLGRYVGNVDDAIAGSLNNTFRFPQLTQEDVEVCIAQRWLVLALDGFDELVARVGVRDAFLHITTLLDRLRGSGTIILSARDRFFDLFEIRAGIRTYLAPSSGDYRMVSFRLDPWGKTEGERVFSFAGSSTPEADYSALKETFSADSRIVTHPLFLTRLARLWCEGERFSDEALGAEAAREQFVIESFLQRENAEKWTDRDGTPLLSESGHRSMLGRIAEEMWRSGAFKLSDEELRIAAELGLSQGGFSAEVTARAVDRIGTHAALTSTQDGRVAFMHDEFLAFFLGHRLFEDLRGGASESASPILRSGEIGPRSAMWCAHFARTAGDVRKVVDSLNHVLRQSKEGSSGFIGQNCGSIFVELVSGDRQREYALTMYGATFIGEVLKGSEIRYAEFVNCNFWMMSLAGTVFADCALQRCHFSHVELDDDTRFRRTVVADPRFEGVLFADRSIFGPGPTARAVERLGAEVRLSSSLPPTSHAPSVDGEILACIEALLRAADKSWCFPVDEIADEFPDVGPKVIRAAFSSGVLVQKKKSVSGPKRRFASFDVERADVLKGVDPSEPLRQELTAFWSELGVARVVEG